MSDKYQYGLTRKQYQTYQTLRRESKLDLIWSDLMVKLDNVLRNEARYSGYMLEEVGQDDDGSIYVQIWPNNPSSDLKTSLARANNLIKIA